MSINIYNPSVITEWLRQKAGKDTEIAFWLDVALGKSLRKRPESAEVLTELPQDAPPWLQNKWDALGGIYHRFKPDEDLERQVDEVVDWFAAAKRDNAEFLKKVDDQNRPLKLLKLGSLDAAVTAANKYYLNQQTSQEESGDIKEVMTFANGCRVVELLTENALRYEGPLMQHCVGKGGYDNKLRVKTHRFFSLRDKNNKPHVTFEIDAKENTLLQCKGKNNKPPVEKYMKMSQEFVLREKFKLKEATSHTGLIQDIHGVIHSVYNLPDELEIDGDLKLDHCPWLTRLPKKLKVGGGIFLEGCTSLTTLPEGLERVEGELDLRGCSKLERLPQRLSVSGSLYLGNCNSLVYMPETLSVGGTLDLNKCASLVETPKILNVGEFLNIHDCPKIARLPDVIQTRGEINVIGCDQLEVLPRTLQTEAFIIGRCPKICALPENINANRITIDQCPGILKMLESKPSFPDLIISNCPELTHLPENFTIHGSLALFTCDELACLPPNLSVERRLFLSGPSKLKTIPRTITAKEGILIGMHLFDNIDTAARALESDFGRKIPPATLQKNHQSSVSL